MDFLRDGLPERVDAEAVESAVRLLAFGGATISMTCRSALRAYLTALSSSAPGVGLAPKSDV